MGRVPDLVAGGARGDLGKLPGFLSQHCAPVRCACGTFGQSQLPSDAESPKCVSLRPDLECGVSLGIADARPVRGRVCPERPPC